LLPDPFHISPIGLPPSPHGTMKASPQPTTRVVITSCLSLVLLPLALGFTFPAALAPHTSPAGASSLAAGRRFVHGHHAAVGGDGGGGGGGESSSPKETRRDFMHAAAASFLAAAAAALAPAGAVADDDPNSFLSRMDRGSTDGMNRGVAPPSSVRNKDDGRVFATLTPPFQPGYAVQVAFVSPWKEKKSSVMNFGDTAKTQDAFVALSALPAAPAAVDALPQDVLLEALLGKDTRFGTYGSAGNIKVRSDTTAPGTDGTPLRILDVSFTSQGAQLEVDKRVQVAARVVLPPSGGGGGPATLALLVSGTSKGKYADSEADVKQMTTTFVAKPTAQKALESWL